jgi:hypothetical protein
MAPYYSIYQDRGRLLRGVASVAVFVAPWRETFLATGATFEQRAQRFPEQIMTGS